MDPTVMAAAITAGVSLVLGIINSRKKVNNNRVKSVEERLTMAFDRIVFLENKVKECENERTALSKQVRELLVENFELRKASKNE